MNRRVLAILLVLIAALSLQGCVGIKGVRGSGNSDEKVYEVSDFTAVEIATLGNLYVEFGDTESLRIEADGNLLRYFEVVVRNGTLRIEHKNANTLIPKDPINFYLTARSLDRIAVSGLCNVKVEDDVETDRFTLAISGGGNVDLAELYADTFVVNISGLGNLSVAGGEVEQQEIFISGGGNVKARALRTTDTTIRVSGLGSATVNVNDHLKVTISGGGSVEYLGSPSVEQNISGLGHVESLSD